MNNIFTSEILHAILVLSLEFCIASRLFFLPSHMHRKRLLYKKKFITNFLNALLCITLFGLLTDFSGDLQAEPSAGGAGVTGLRVHGEGAVLPDGV